jgi:hypothetical protein
MRIVSMIAVILICAAAVPAAEPFTVTAPPAELKIPEFYAKYIDADGYPIVASKTVNDYALKEAAYWVAKMLEHRPDVKKAMVASGSRMCIIAYNEYTTDLPEFAWLKPKDYWDARARGTGGSKSDPYCSSAEENLLAYPGDPYHQECILIHEFAHNIHLRGMIASRRLTTRQSLPGCGLANMRQRIITNTLPKACSRGSTTTGRPIMTITMSTHGPNCSNTIRDWQHCVRKSSAIWN